MKRQQKLTIGLFAVYMLLLIWIILFKLQFSLNDINFRSINLIPFAESTIINGKIDLSEIIYNIIVFIPFGIFMSMLKPNWSFLKKATLVAGLSLIFELLQYIFAIGASDITDLINNTLGGIIGIVVYTVFLKLLKTNERTNKVINILALIIAVCLIILIASVIIANL